MSVNTEAFHQESLSQLAGQVAIVDGHEQSITHVEEDHERVLIHEPTTIIADPAKVPTRAEIKRWNRQFITRILGRVKACGHRYNHDRQPRHRNCPHCWFAFFQNHGELVQTTDELHNTEGGIQMILDLQGSKFLKQFRRFMSTIAHVKGSTNEGHQEQGNQAV